MDAMPRQDGKSEFYPQNCDVEFKNVDFSYQDGVQTLKNVSFTAKQGNVTALVGPSGGGKSTVAKLSARFWDIDKGVITLGGEDISLVDPETLFNYYSIVFQDVTLFNSSVMDNIRLGKKGAPDEEVMNAARLAQCDEFVKKLPQGYDTLIGENGARLSGGERQRISIARAILKDAPIILLDEATAALDTENESKIQSALSELVKNKTVLIIAHRMRTVSGADQIVVIKDGAIAETGAPSELKVKQGIFAAMLKTQYQNN
jgi:ATP-binding cassette subfamily B protein IrtB